MLYNLIVMSYEKGVNKSALINLLHLLLVTGLPHTHSTHYILKF